MCWSVQLRSVTLRANRPPWPAIPAAGAFTCCKKFTLAVPSSAPSRPGPRSLPVTAGAGSRTSCRPGSPRGGAYGTGRRSCSLLCPPFALLVSLSLGIRADEMPSVPARRRSARPDLPAFADRAEAGVRLGGALRQAHGEIQLPSFRTAGGLRHSPRRSRGRGRRRPVPRRSARGDRGAEDRPPGGAGVRARRDRGGRRTGLRRRGAGRGRADRGRPGRGRGAGAGGTGAAGRRLPRCRTGQTRPSARGWRSWSTTGWRPA